MYYIKTDETGYLTALDVIDNGGIAIDMDIADYDFSNYFIQSYKFENGMIVLDEARATQLEEQRLAEIEQNELRKQTEEQRLADIESALELLLSGATQ